MKNKKHGGHPNKQTPQVRPEIKTEYETAMPVEKEVIAVHESNPMMIPIAIVLAGIFIAGAILWNGSRTPAPAPGSLAALLKKGTIAEEIGLNKKKFAECLSSRRYQSFVQSSIDSGAKNGVQGTPYSFVIAKNGAILEINGAQPTAEIKKVIDLALSGEAITMKSSNTGETLAIDPVIAKDHLFGNPNADVKIVTYSDFECPFCKRFHGTMEEIMKEYEKEGKVAWIIRPFPLAQLHDKAPYEAEASECANEIGGNAKYWEYVSLLEKITPANNEFDPALL